jgi:hypothetical protein
MLFRLDEVIGYRLEVKGDEEVKGYRLEVKGSENGEVDTCASRLLPLASRQEDWHNLIDRLRVTGLMEYWLDKRYHDKAAEELKKVDWSKQPLSVIRMYKMPIWMLKLKRNVMRVGSYMKQFIIRRNGACVQ